MSFYGVRLLACNGQLAMTIHSVQLVLLKIEVLIQTLLGTHPLTLYTERTVAHTYQYDIILNNSKCRVHVTH